MVTAQQCDLLLNWAGAWGGALYVMGGTVTLRQNRVLMNHAKNGGALAVMPSITVPSRVIMAAPGSAKDSFASNVATNGGAWYLSGGADVTVLGNVDMMYNMAQRDGGAIYMTNNAVLVIACTNGARMLCEANEAGWYGGAVAVHAGALLDGQGLVCDNNRSSRGGALYANAGSVVVHYDEALPHLTLPLNRLRGNQALDAGGGLYACEGAQVTLREIGLVTNYANYGGGIYATHNARCSMINALMISNMCGVNGAAGFITRTSTLHAAHTTIAHSSHGIAAYYGAQAIVTNCILWNQSAQFGLGSGATALVYYSDMRGGWPGPGNINADPRFVDPAEYNYQLAADSPCINTGINAGVSYDCIGTPRPYGGGYDLGAYEFVPEPGVGGALLGVGFTIYKLQITIWRRRREK